MHGTRTLPSGGWGTLTPAQGTEAKLRCVMSGADGSRLAEGLAVWERPG